MAFQQKWIFLNKVLHEMKIQFPSAELVGKEVKQNGHLLNSGAQGVRGNNHFILAFALTLSTAHSFQGFG